ncbi:Ankyrin repeat-containing protein NPR4 [Bienertia sinuspersici]
MREWCWEEMKVLMMEMEVRRRRRESTWDRDVGGDVVVEGVAEGEDVGGWCVERGGGERVAEGGGMYEQIEFNKELGRWLVEQEPEFITLPDKEGTTALDLAFNIGATWIIEEMLGKDPLSIFNNTPLAWIKACENGHLSIVRVFVNCYRGRYNIKDNENRTAKDLLAHLCREQRQWDQMCKNIGFDPNLRTSYFQRKTDLLEVRNTLSVVAALLATITFTAGFTLPGGFERNHWRGNIG